MTYIILSSQEGPMPPQTIFPIHLVSGYVVWLFCFGA